MTNDSDEFVNTTRSCSQRAQEDTYAVLVASIAVSASVSRLTRLAEQELQELAAKTNGRVKGNISTVEMIRALRRESAGVVASEP